MRLVNLVFPDLPPRRFTYTIPDEIENLPEIGSRVIAPFRNSPRIGIVVSYPSGSTVPIDRLQPITTILDDEASGDELTGKLAHWISKYYLCSESDAFRLLMPAGSIKRSSRSVELIVRNPTEKAVLKGRRQREIVDFLTNRGKVRVIEIKRAFPGVNVSSILKRLKEIGIIKLYESPLYHTQKRPSKRSLGYRPESFPDDSGIDDEISTIAQETAIKTISSIMKKGVFRPFLLHGVTGSGKTHIYLKLARKAVEAGKTVLVLVPEIALTPQLSGRFSSYFPGIVAVLHSGLSAGSRRAAWKESKSGKIKIVIGARSAVFAPLPNLGLIVVDEEQDSSYKQSDSPYYNARDVAIVRGKLAGTPVLLGSATPSVESYFNAEKGKYTLLELKERIDDRPLPDVEIVDMKRELKAGNRSVLSGRLAELLEETVNRGEQAILLLNRRGFFSTMKCGVCGETIECPNCAVSMTIHRKGNSLVCHFCGYTTPIPEICPYCGGETFKFRGFGTERVEKELLAFFPWMKIERMDMDTTRRRGSHLKILSSFAKHESDVLVGTQMVAKGHDFPGVTLVGIISADIGLHVPDFRAGERAFQLMTQAAGRAGRREMKGKVIIQTFQPQHYTVKAAAEHSYSEFYSREIKARKSSGYPPYSRMIHIKFFSADYDAVKKAAGKAASLLRTNISPEIINLLGPAPFPIPRIKREYIRHIIIKSRNIRKALLRLEKDDWKPDTGGKVRYSIIVDPSNIF